MSDDASDKASANYDRAERAYIVALASGADDAALRSLARQVADAARTWESVDNAAPNSSDGISRYYDLPEVISTLWRDLADAHDQRAK